MHDDVTFTKQSNSEGGDRLADLGLQTRVSAAIYRAKACRNEHSRRARPARLTRRRGKPKLTHFQNADGWRAKSTNLTALQSPSPPSSP